MTAQFQNNVICTSHASTQANISSTRRAPRDRRKLALFTTVCLSDTISGSNIHKKLDTSRPRGRLKARVTFMRKLLRKTRYFPLSTVANKGGQISSPLCSQRRNTNFSRFAPFSRKKHGTAQQSRETTRQKQFRTNVENNSGLNAIRRRKLQNYSILCPFFNLERYYDCWSNDRKRLWREDFVN